MPSSRSAQTDEVLMLAYVEGDGDALTELFRRYATRLRALMRAGLSNTSHAEDLVQETFLQLHRARRDFRPDAMLRPWLMTIALNLKRDYLRRARRRPEVALDDQFEMPAVANAEGRLIAQDALRKALPELAEPYREVVELHWFADLSFAEIAATLGTSESAVKVRAHRAYKKMRAALGGKTA